jgi:hypothetical protein
MSDLNNSKSGFLYMEVSLSDLCNIAYRLGRYEQLGGYEGLKALHGFYTELSRDIGEPIEVDVVSWCTEWAHYETLEDAMRDLGFSQKEMEDGNVIVLELDNEAGYLVNLSHKSDS